MQLNQLKSLLSRFHIRPNKLLGQNFLLSEKVLDEIIAAAELTKADTVLEIGPGLGFLTVRLAEKAGEVIAIEKDRRMVKALEKIFKNTENVEIIKGDALTLDTLRITNGYESTNSYIRSDSLFVDNFKIVANIPYYLTGKILQKFLTSDANTSASGGHANDANSRHSREDSRHSSRLSLMVLLLQKEVAERIVAKPGEMSILSVSVQFYAGPEIISFVGKENFYPLPEVDSAIVRLRVLPQSRFAPSLNPSPLAGEGRERGMNEKKFFQLVKIGFANKRKQLKNNLRALFNAKNAKIHANASNIPSPFPLPLERGRGGEGIEVSHYIKKLLLSLGLDPLCRAQDLSLEDWKKLYDKLF